MGWGCWSIGGVAGAFGRSWSISGELLELLGGAGAFRVGVLGHWGVAEAFGGHNSAPCWFTPIPTPGQAAEPNSRSGGAVGRWVGTGHARACGPLAGACACATHVPSHAGRDAGLRGHHQRGPRGHRSRSGGNASPATRSRSASGRHGLRGRRDRTDGQPRTDATALSLLSQPCAAAPASV